MSRVRRSLLLPAPPYPGALPACPAAQPQPGEQQRDVPRGSSRSSSPFAASLPNLEIEVTSLRMGHVPTGSIGAPVGRAELRLRAPRTPARLVRCRRREPREGVRRLRTPRSENCLSGASLTQHPCTLAMPTPSFQHPVSIAFWVSWF